jgi:uncharacterized protein YaiI (UPF0178 family)
MIDVDLITRISGRRVIVDACISRELVNTLRRNGLVVRHVIDINAKLQDQEIANLMYEDEVLITRDYEFYTALGIDKAILLSSESDALATNGKSMVKSNRGIPRRRKLPSHIRMALREKIAEESMTGLLYMKILWCIMWLAFPIA